MKSSVSKNCSESNLQYLRPFDLRAKKKRNCRRRRKNGNSLRSERSSVSNLQQLLVKPAATLQLLKPSRYTQQCLRHNQRSAWFCSDQISLRSDILLTSDLSERLGLVVSLPSTRVCSRDEQLVSRFIHSNQHQQFSFNSRLDRIYNKSQCRQRKMCHVYVAREIAGETIHLFTLSKLLTLDQRSDYQSK